MVLAQEQGQWERQRGSEGTEAAPPPSPGVQGLRWGGGVTRGGGLELGLAGLRRGAPRVIRSWTSGSPPQRYRAPPYFRQP